MLLKNRIDTLSALGSYIISELDGEIADWSRRAHNQNQWFSEDNVRMALKNIAEHFLNEQKLSEWLKKYPTSPAESKKIGIVMAGNIPAVGFQDALCVLASGHILLAKLSSSDSVLMQALFDKIIELNPDFKPFIHIVERLNEADAYIATGSDNTARTFEHYFAKKPHIIRRNRSSVAILNGDETPADYRNLSQDVFQYFGLGCRSVSKFYVPESFTVDAFYESITHWDTIVLHHKYLNNYDYKKSIYLINYTEFFDNGFLMLKPDTTLVSPISVVFFEKYSSKGHLEELIKVNEDKIQCIVAKEAWYADSVPFGMSQQPSLQNYADGIDTMQFLERL